MQCFHVLIHGRFAELVQLAPELPMLGFYTSRWVLAGDEGQATSKAFRLAERELQKLPDIRDGLIGMTMETEIVEPAAIWRVWSRGNRGFSFYGED